ncbi:MAG: polysaccharide biosynthesis tyrosine autokinase [Verrucomicrobiae bacterium]|nr:polysaccharide biosynthesis tyrosine autokinase [Verrucomicrobiae bacterium]
MANGFSFNTIIRYLSLNLLKLVLFFLGFFLLATGFYFYHAPKYTAKATLELTRSFSSGKEIEFHQTSLKQRDILYPVIEQLHLNQRWSSESKSPLTLENTYRLLFKKIRFIPYESSSFLEIQVTGNSLNEAMAIARAVAQSYTFFYQRRLNPDLEENTADLRDTIQKQTLLVQTLSSQLSTLTNQATHHLAEIQKSEGLERRWAEEKALLDEKKRQWNLVKDLSSIDLADHFIKTGVETSLISDLLSQYRDLEAQMEQLLIEGYGKDHPRFQEAAELLVGIQKRLGSIVLSLRQDMENEMIASEKKMETFKKEMEETQKIQQSLPPSEKIISLQNKLTQAQSQLERDEQTYETLLQKNYQSSKLPPPILIRGDVEGHAWQPDWVKLVNIGGIGALGLAIITLLGIRGLDRSVKTIDQFERATGISVLAVIPQDVPTLNHAQAASPHAEGYRLLKAKIENKLSACRTLTLISGGMGEGKSTTLFNLAWVIAESGAKTLLVDADLRRPRLHKILNLPNAIGLGQLLTQTRSISEAITATRLPNLDFISSGLVTEAAMQSFNSDRLEEIMTELKKDYEWILWDAPPIIGVSDALRLVRGVQGVIMVVKPHQYPLYVAQRVKNILQENNVKILGAVFNNVDTREHELYEFYTAYYDYYDPEEK